ncbi:ribonuclease H-like domain-containing protein [Kurthia massiliensis]|uniref:ribonuclease H-like domain-containing protein n=1 Tax=Kurthia massiliensis TaxID=1033739 RepID=UPI0002887A9B|nr:ribonuclease H-like domain-containing protein [Kurthia massiliensis]
MSYENKILAMKKMMKKKAPAKAEKPAYVKPAAPSYSDAWERAGLTRIDNDFGTVFVREVHYRYDYVHGNIALGDFIKALDVWQQQTHPIALDADSTIVFFDTETTGLKGTGTHIFLNGLLTFDEGTFTLKQYVLADPSHEAAFLFESKFWQRGQSVVTYNGKSFDWPQLEMRWTFHRDVLPPLQKPMHVDLMHMAKRIWKSDVASMKLSAIEHEKLGFTRVGDVPGYLAPVIYLDAVRSGETDALMKVLVHNEYDLLSLVTLYTKATQLLTEGVQQESAQAYTNIGKWYKDLKESDESLALLRAVTTLYDVQEAAEASFYQGYLLKKQGNYTGAFEHFTLCIPYMPERQRIEAYIELAKLCEHQLDDLASALRYSEEALALTKQSICYQPTAKMKRIDALRHRIERLTKKNML